MIELSRGLDQEDAHGEQEPWIPAEHPLGWCLTGWGSARDAASFFLPSTLARFGPLKSEARPCGVDTADPGPSSSLSPGPPARFPSGSAGQPSTSAKRRAAVSTDRWSLHASGRSVMVPGAFTGAARSGCGQPDVHPLARQSGSLTSRDLPIAIGGRPRLVMPTRSGWSFSRSFPQP